MQSCSDMMTMGAMGEGSVCNTSPFRVFGDKAACRPARQRQIPRLVHAGGNVPDRPVPFWAGYNCTMVQMAAAFCSVLNTGVLL